MTNLTLQTHSPLLAACASSSDRPPESNASSIQVPFTFRIPAKSDEACKNYIRNCMEFTKIIYTRLSMMELKESYVWRVVKTASASPHKQEALFLNKESFKEKIHEYDIKEDQLAAETTKPQDGQPIFQKAISDQNQAHSFEFFWKKAYCCAQDIFTTSFAVQNCFPYPDSLLDVISFVPETQKRNLMVHDILENLKETISKLKTISEELKKLGNDEQVREVEQKIDHLDTEIEKQRKLKQIFSVSNVTETLIQAGEQILTEHQFTVTVPKDYFLLDIIQTCASKLQQCNEEFTKKSYNGSDFWVINQISANFLGPRIKQPLQYAATLQAAEAYLCENHWYADLPSFDLAEYLGRYDCVTKSPSSTKRSYTKRCVVVEDETPTCSELYSTLEKITVLVDPTGDYYLLSDYSESSFDKPFEKIPQSLITTSKISDTKKSQMAMELNQSATEQLDRAQQLLDSLKARHS